MASTMATTMRMAPAWSLESPPRRRPAPPQKLQRRKKSATRAIIPTRIPTKRREADVVVADVRHLVGDHALQLVAVEHLHHPARDGDRGVLRVAPGGEGVGRRLLDDVDRRHVGQAGGDRHLLDDVEELRLVLVGHLVGAADGEHHLVAGVVAEEAPGDGHDAEHAEEPEAAAGASDDGGADGEAQRGQQGDDEPHEKPGGSPVAADLLVHRRVAESGC